MYCLSTHISIAPMLKDEIDFNQVVPYPSTIILITHNESSLPNPLGLRTCSAKLAVVITTSYE